MERAGAALAEAVYRFAGPMPALVLCGRAMRRERLPCFLLGQTLALLPAFGSFTGLAAVEPGPEDRAFVVADGDVIEVRPVG